MQNSEMDRLTVATIFGSSALNCSVKVGTIASSKSINVLHR